MRPGYYHLSVVRLCLPHFLPTFSAPLCVHAEQNGCSKDRVPSVSHLHSQTVGSLAPVFGLQNRIWTAGSGYIGFVFLGFFLLREGCVLLGRRAVARPLRLSVQAPPGYQVSNAST